MSEVEWIACSECGEEFDKSQLKKCPACGLEIDFLSGRFLRPSILRQIQEENPREEFPLSPPEDYLLRMIHELRQDLLQVQNQVGKGVKRLGWVVFFLLLPYVIFFGYLIWFSSE